MPLPETYYTLHQLFIYGVNVEAAKRNKNKNQTLLYFPRSTTLVGRSGWWSPQGSVFPPLRWLKVTWTPISDFSISGSHAIVIQKHTGCHSLYLNYKIAQKCIFPMYLCATIWWHIQRQTSSSILLLQINIWDKNPFGTKSQAFKQIRFFSKPFNS